MHYQRTRRDAASAVVGRNTTTTVKNGADWDLEEQAEELLLRDMEIRGESETDFLTNRQLASLAYKEVYTSTGVPDENLFQGRVFRAYNPLMGKRPSRQNMADS